MSLQDMKIKLTEHKVIDMSELPKFSLGYKTYKSEDRSRNSSYGIISALKQDNDIIIEINDSLLSMRKRDRENFVSEFLKMLDSLEINYARNKVPYVPSRGLLSFFSKPKLEEAINICFTITKNQWNSESFKKAYPHYGAKYYICNPDKPVNADELSDMSNEKKLDIFDFIIFDSGVLHSMGINSKTKSIGDIKKLLGI